MSNTDMLKRGMSPTHEMMVEWVLENPGGTLREMGAYFGYSQSWLSQVCNTDMFKAQVAERMGEVQAVVTSDIPARMRTLATLACDRMEELLSKTEDGDLIKDSFDKVMHRYGYAPNARNGAQSQPAGIGQQNNFFLSRDQFNSVHEKLVKAHAPRSLAQPVQEDAEQSITDNSEV